MSAATFGRIQEFDGDKEEWPQYVERLGHFFLANGIENADKKRAVFLSVVGPATYKTLRNLVSPAKPGDKTYDELVEVLAKHYKPTPSEIVERFKFHSRFRKAGESVATFVAELRCLSEFCNFGKSLQDMIRDRLVCGINDEAIQKQLLSKPKLTYEQAVELALSLERAAQNIQDLKTRKEGSGHNQPRQQEVHGVSSTGSPVGSTGLTCYRCGNKGHTVAKCRVSKDMVCNKCGKLGYLQRACRGKKKGTQQPRTGKWNKTQTVCQVQEGTESEPEEETLCHVRSKNSTSSPPIEVEVKVDDCLITMEVDTGASMSLMPVSTFKTLWPRRGLQQSDVRLRTYSKNPIPVVGSCVVVVEYNGQTASQMLLVIVEGSGPTLMGRNWLEKIRLDWRQIHHVYTPSLNVVLDSYPAVFLGGLGTLQGFKAKIYVDPNAKPSFHRARSVPYALRDKVETELQRLQEEGTIESVEMAEWAAPIVPVLKHDKKHVRICGDFRMTVNPVSKLDKYPIPKVADPFSCLSKGKLFTKLDLSQAYQQLPLEDGSKQYVVINTHRGLFRYTRLPFGISSAPGIFQRVIERLLQGVKGVAVYLDDILITGSTESEHLKTLDEVLSRLDKAGLRVRKDKCEFMKSSVSYLGHRIDATGLHPLPDKVHAVNKDVPTPKSVHELRSYLGILTYYSKFLPNLSSTLYPLYKLLKKDVPWTWGPQQVKAFAASKDLLTSKRLLAHYDSTQDLTLACDASGYGLGVVLAHKASDGSEKPIGYASRTLTPAERNYSQLEKEALSCIFGIKKFHDYLFGRSFELVTDHKPLLGLLKEDRATPPQASARIKRWSLFLAGYEYTLVFRNTKAHANADALSRLPLPVVPETTEEEPELVLLAEHLSDSPVTANDIRFWTKHDTKLSRVLQFQKQGWPTEGDRDLEPYSSKRFELSTYEGCLLWGTRIVVPKPGRDAVLQELHEGHPGITKMRALARMYVWWPGIDLDIERSVRLCRQCQEVQSSPPVAPLNPWKWPTRQATFRLCWAISGKDHTHSD